ncbi:hypothetical protein AAZX31_04G232400 [Glycine max]
MGLATVTLQLLVCLKLVCYQRTSLIEPSPIAAKWHVQLRHTSTNKAPPRANFCTTQTVE